MSAKQQGKDPMIGPYKDMDTPKGLDEAGVWMPDREKTDKRNSLMQDTTKNAAYKAKEAEAAGKTDPEFKTPVFPMKKHIDKFDGIKYAGMGAVVLGGVYVAAKMLRR
ncbi:hypothetical protein Ddc_13373 [Ditylenchus destructor]|nr:hypothetical protein Ddc_13373 [Ditylenchus destructor]